MRVWGLFAVVFVVALTGVGAAKPLSVADIVQSPRTYMDTVVTVQGVMIPGWKVCDEPFGKSEGWKNDYGAAWCVNVDEIRNEFTTREEKYIGARVILAGPYWHRCLEEIRQAEPERIRADCKDEGRNGWIGPTSVEILGYVILQPKRDAAPSERKELAHPTVDELARKFVLASRRGDADLLAELFPPNLRGRYRATLKQKVTRDYWKFLSPEMSRLGANAARASVGFKHYGGGLWGLMCFCREDSCEGRWPTIGADTEWPQNLARPYVCHATGFVDGRWYLED